MPRSAENRRGLAFAVLDCGGDTMSERDRRSGFRDQDRYRDSPRMGDERRQLTADVNRVDDRNDFGREGARRFEPIRDEYSHQGTDGHGYRYGFSDSGGYRPERDVARELEHSPLRGWRPWPRWQVWLRLGREARAKPQWFRGHRLVPKSRRAHRRRSRSHQSIARQPRRHVVNAAGVIYDRRALATCEYITAAVWCGGRER